MQCAFKTCNNTIIATLVGQGNKAHVYEEVMQGVLDHNSQGKYLNVHISHTKYNIFFHEENIMVITFHKCQDIE